MRIIERLGLAVLIILMAPPLAILLTVAFVWGGFQALYNDAFKD